MKESAKAIGQSRNSYDFAGTIMSRQQDTDYPDYETVITNIRQIKGGPIYIDKGATVTVSMTETDRVKEGQKVEFIAQFLKGGRINVTALRVLLDKPLKSEEFFKEARKENQPPTHQVVMRCRNLQIWLVTHPAFRLCELGIRL